MRVALILLIVSSIVTGSFGLPLGDMPPRMLVSEAQNRIAKGGFAGTLSYLDELEIRIQDEDDTAIAKVFWKFVFVHANGYLQSFEKAGNQEHLRKAARDFVFFRENFRTIRKLS